MSNNENPLADPKVWISAAALLVSGLSLAISFRSSRNAARALAISERQEERRHPKLHIHVNKGIRLRLQSMQLFGFQVSIKNPTDINNCVARAELEVNFALETKTTMILRIQHDSDLKVAIKSDSSLVLPLRIEAHQTVSGLLLFAIDNAVGGTGTVDSHCLLLEDTHGLSMKSEPIIVKEWNNEAKMD
jgi:hypothetical protein